MGKESKTIKVFKYMKKFGSISGKEAMSVLHLYRLSDAIFKLRNMGVEIVTEMVEFEYNGEKTRYARYFISPSNTFDPTNKKEQSADSEVA